MWLADVDLLSSEALWVVQGYQEGLYRHKVEPVNLHLKQNAIYISKWRTK